MNRIALAALASFLAPAVAVAADGKIQPGQWRITDTVLEMKNPAMSPEMVQRRMAKPLVVESCVRTEDLREYLVGRDQGGLCKGEMSFAGGKISVDRACPNSTRKIQGTYTATRIETTREATVDLPTGKAFTRSKVVNERLGECK